MKFSIIIPVYNAACFLEACLNSLLRQEFEDYEVILINDGSSDASAEICQAYAERNENIRYVYQENRGPSSARNHGINLARGDYLLFLDADDRVTAHSLKRLSMLIDASGTDAVISRLIVFDEERRTTFVAGPALEAERIAAGKDEALEELSRKRFNTPASAVIIKRSIVEKYAVRFSENYRIGEDIFMMSQALCRCNTYCYNEEPYYCYRQNSESIMHTVSFKTMAPIMDLCEEMATLAQSVSGAEKLLMHTQMSMMLVNLAKSYWSFESVRKKEIRMWMKRNCRLVKYLADLHPITKTVGRYIGNGNAFLLAGLVFYMVAENSKGKSVWKKSA